MIRLQQFNVWKMCLTHCIDVGQTQQYLNTIHSPDEVEEKLGLSELG